MAIRLSAKPPYIVAPLPKCSIIVDRHTHKNGGSTTRSVLNANDMRDGWIYWGYGLHQHEMIVNRVIHTLLGPRNQSCDDWRTRKPLRLIAEHHYTRHGLEAILSHFGPYSPLQRAAAQCRCRVVLVTRLREPLSFYMSFYRWTVNWRQQRNASAFGTTLLEWAPRNLQASMLLNPLDATWAEFVGVHSPEAKMRRPIYSQFDEPGGPYPGGIGRMPPGAGAKRRAALSLVLSSFDLVGLVERFDETLLLLADLSGIQRLLYTRLVPGTTNPHYRQPSAEEVCPDVALCRQRLRDVAPVDHEMYGVAAANFEARVRSLGAPFQKRLAAYRASLAAYQTLRAKQEKDLTPAAQPRVIERSSSSGTEMHTRVPIRRLKCFLGDGELGSETCQRVFADTSFRYNWRHTPRSCCMRISHCVRHHLTRRSRLPLACHRWLPAIVEEKKDKLTFLANILSATGPSGGGRARARQARLKREAEINASLPALCARECTLPPDPERGVAPAYRVPSSAELAALPAPFVTRTWQQQATLKGVYTGGGNLYDGAMAIAAAHPGKFCNDTRAELVAGKPWLDFDNCHAEGETRENLVSTFGPCSRILWMRTNCRRTCGLCGFGLRELMNLRPWQALKAARLAAHARESNALFLRGGLSKVELASLKTLKAEFAQVYSNRA